ncbi:MULTISPECIES: response regulator transcription factor [Paenibacillus]|uniref:response regulator transcription factor n=1 Tax=Paenibacillus TaxID=44249 RepID=UPI000BA77415|nr:MULTISPECIES: response regulator transcription factor [Paenibacillus]MBE7683118.1 response regulator [Paenibacillus sp. P13VS]MCM3207517.1 response regulator transcription factor [Paenibacillus illinoisensis]PAF28977.1 DNA-binding response regulator [Paenibacillus sp. 7516]WJH27682.1 response regulator transcription factor [Paenibacillus sp. CC-CFT742]
MVRTVLLVEDESRIREIVADYFIKEQWNVIEAEHGIEALQLLDLHEVDLVILDVLMPEMDGWTLCEHIRSQSTVPIIMLTARSEDDDKIHGFNLGVDDYVTKPFSPRVLVARAETLMKRVEGAISREQGVIRFGHALLDPWARRLEMNGMEVELAPKEYELLLYLARNQGIVLSRDAILNRVWGYDFDGDSRVVDTHIKKLRSKLGDEAKCIRTVIGTGYRFEAEA